MITPRMDLPNLHRSLDLGIDLAESPAPVRQPIQQVAPDFDLEEETRARVDATCTVIPLSWDFVHKRFHRSMMMLDRGRGRFTHVSADTIYKMRNLGVEWARSIEARYLLMLDADMTFPPDTLRRLHAHRQPIVGGLCRQRREPFAACLWEEREGKIWRVPPIGEGLRAISHTGGACLLIDMAVFGTLDHMFPGEPYFMNRECYAEKVVEGDYTGEDIWFCERARQAGYEIYVDQALKIGHCTSAIIADDDQHRPTALLEKGMD